MKIEFIFSEFGPRPQANQQWVNSIPRLDPTYSSVKTYFPEANLVLYTDRPEIKNDYKDIEVRLIDVDKSPFNKKNHRWGWHCCDYYQVLGLLNSKADIAKYDELKEKKDSLFREGATVLEDALQSNPDNESILTQLKNIYGALGDNENFMRIKKLLGE